MIILLITLQQEAKAQRDTLFWFVAPNLTTGHGAGPMMLRFSAFNKEARVWIEQPANPFFPAVEVTVPANGTISFNLSNHSNFLMNSPPAQILPYGLRIRSTEEIFVYYESNREINPDIFSLKGRNALGLDFWIPMQNSYPSGGYNPPARAGFDIVATEDNTEVVVTPAHNAVGHPAGIPFTIQLNLGQTYSIIAESASANAKLSGSRVSSNRPIAVTIKDDSSRGPSGPCADLNGDQMVPVEVLGNEYIVVRGFLNPHDNVYVLATRDSTEIFINGDWVARLDQGEMYSSNLVQDAIYLSSTHPVYVKHLSGYGCEVGAAILPKVDCTGSQKVSFVRSTGAGFFLILYTEAGFEDAFLLNGDSGILTEDLFRDVPGTQGKYKFARVTLTEAQVPTGGISYVANTKGLFHMGMVNGSPAGGTRYGYFSDFSSFLVEASALPQDICEGDSLWVGASFFPNATYEWMGPDDFSTTDPSWTLPQASLSAEGWYSVRAQVPGCPGSVDSIYISVTPVPEIGDYGVTDPVCQGGTLVFFAEVEDNQQVNWLGPNGFSNLSASFEIEGAEEADGGKYSFYIVEGICNSDTVEVEVIVHPQYSSYEAIENCASYTWPINGEKYVESGIYTELFATQWGCDSIFYLELVLIPEFLESERVSACDSFVWPLNGQVFDNGGTYVESFTNILGCDSSYVLELHLSPSFAIFLEETACDAFFWEGQWLRESGRYRKDTLTTFGCDSSVVLDLAVYASQREEFVEIACGTFEWLDQLWDVSGEYRQVFETENGCDSLLILDLTIYPEWEVADNWRVCDSVYWEGTWIRESGIYMEIYESEYGCDSLVRVEIEVATSTQRIEQVASVSSYTWPVNNENYFATGRYEALFKGSDGCDSLVILDLEILDPEKIWLPNVFHPQDNGSNAKFYVFATEGVERIERMLIFDRWGGLVFEGIGFPPNNALYGWDGTFKGQPVDSGVFVYTVEWIDGFGERRRKNGDVTLLR